MNSTCASVSPCSWELWICIIIGPMIIIIKADEEVELRQFRDWSPFCSVIGRIEGPAKYKQWKKNKKRFKCQIWIIFGHCSILTSLNHNFCLLVPGCYLCHHTLSSVFFSSESSSSSPMLSSPSAVVNSFLSSPTFTPLMWWVWAAGTVLRNTFES